MKRKAEGNPDIPSGITRELYLVHALRRDEDEWRLFCLGHEIEDETVAFLNEHPDALEAAFGPVVSHEVFYAYMKEAVPRLVTRENFLRQHRIKPAVFDYMGRSLTALIEKYGIDAPAREPVEDLRESGPCANGYWNVAVNGHKLLVEFLAEHVGASAEDLAGLGAARAAKVRAARPEANPASNEEVEDLKVSIEAVRKAVEDLKRTFRTLASVSVHASEASDASEHE